MDLHLLVYWPIIEAEDLAREASFAQGITRDDWRYLNRILILSFRGLVITVPAFHTLISLYKIQSSRDRRIPPKNIHRSHMS